MKRIVWLFVTLFTLIFGVLFAYYTRPSELPLRENALAQTLRICTSNINYRNSFSRKLAKKLVQTKSDLFVVPEWQGSNLDLEEFRRNGYRVVLSHPMPGPHGIALIAKSDITVSATIIPSPVQGPCAIPWATAEISYRSRTLVLLGVHAPPPVPACEHTTDPTIKRLAKLIQEGKLVKGLGVGRAGAPVVVAGDLNAFSFNSAVGRLRDAGLADTYSMTNTGYGPTWSPFSWFPSLFRIDYILIPQSYTAVASYTIRLPGSDHRGVVSDIQL